MYGVCGGSRSEDLVVGERETESTRQEERAVRRQLTQDLDFDRVRDLLLFQSSPPTYDHCTSSTFSANQTPHIHVTPFESLN